MSPTMRPDLPPLSFGTASLGNLYEAITAAEAEAVLSAAWEAGLRYFDTAPHYGRGLAEDRLGRFLKGRAEAIVSTKVGRVLSPARRPIEEADGFVSPAQNDVRYDYSGAGITESFEQSLDRLGRDHIDVLFVHDIGRRTHGPANDAHMEAFLSSGYETLVALRRAGRVGAIGLGVNEAEVCCDLIPRCDLDLILLAGRYTLLEQGARQELFPLCEAHGVRLVVGGVFNSGILATGAVAGAHYNYEPAPEAVCRTVTRIEAVCDRHDVPLAAAALQFPGRHPLIASTLIGTGDVGRLRRNIAQFGARLPGALWSDLAAEGLIPG